MDHRSISLELRVDKPDNVYRYIYDWRPVPSSHSPDVFYLMLHALIQWNDFPVNAFCLAVQYSATPGVNVDVSQPVHVLEDDVDALTQAWVDFTRQRRGRR